MHFVANMLKNRGEFRLILIIFLIAMKKIVVFLLEKHYSNYLECHVTLLSLTTHILCFTKSFSKMRKINRTIWIS